ncbi:copper amine oxidase [Microbacterium gilvum]
MMRGRIAAGMVVLVAGGALAACTAAPTGQEGPAQATTYDCESGAPIAQAFDNGSEWAMCWGVDPDRGLVLSDIRFTPAGDEPVLVAEEIAIAQLEVPYDSGENTTYDITSAGFGGTKMQTLTETECTGERVAADIPDIGDGTYGEIKNREVLCAEVVDGGLGYRSGDFGEVVAERREDWQLSTISKVGWYEYVTQYVFGSDGIIRSDLGATGDISPIDFSDHEHGSAVGEGDSAYATSHSHNAVWRIHWALDAPGALAVEQYDAEDTGEMGAQSPIVEGTLERIDHPATAVWEDRRWWRVLAPDVLNDDGHPISYEIELGRSDTFSFTSDRLEHGDAAAYDVAFTNDDPCQLLASRNSLTSDCGRSVHEYIEDSADDQLADVVSWVAVGFHHVVRDEDQSPMDMHWQGFALRPRDLTAQRVAVPEEREDLNGELEGDRADWYQLDDAG